MGIIFSDRAQRCQIKDLLNDPKSRFILNRLQAGRDGGDDMGFGSMPHRLSAEELEILKDEWIYFEESGDCWYARFEKPVNEIRELLGLEPQDALGRPIKKEESLEEEIIDEDKVFVGKLKEYFELPPEIKLLDKQQVEDTIELIDPEALFRVGYVNPIYIYKELWEELPIWKCTEMEGYTGIDFSQSEDKAAYSDPELRRKLAADQIAKEKETGKPEFVGASVEYVKQNKLVMQRDAETAQKKELLTLRHTLLFYPVGRPKVAYFIKLPNTERWGRISEEQLETYIYDNLLKIENKIRVKDHKMWKTKIYNTLYGKDVQDIDRDTRSDTDFKKQAKHIYKYDIEKNTVRSLYTTQFYYLKYFSTRNLNSTELGSTIVESLEEALERNPFDLMFEDINAYGERLTEGKDDTFTCCICGEECTGHGNNPWPVKEEGKCCDACNFHYVIPKRFELSVEAPEDDENL